MYMYMYENTQGLEARQMQNTCMYMCTCIVQLYIMYMYMHMYVFIQSRRH